MTTAEPTPEAPTRPQAVDAAWASVRFMIGVLINMFGPPSELLALGLVMRRWRRDLIEWLRPAEAVLRRLLLLRAAELAAEDGDAAVAKRPVPRLAPQPSPPRPEAEDSARWRGVRFLMIPAPRRLSGGGRHRLPPLPPTETELADAYWRALQGLPPDPKRPRPGYVLLDVGPGVRARGWAGPPKPWTARALALRLEALIRAAHRPESYARRLARLLRAEPLAALRILRPLPDDPGNAARTALQELAEPAAAAASVFLDRFSSA